MARRGNFSQSFLRSKELLAYSEIAYDEEGNNIIDRKVLEEALARDGEGKLIRNKVNIAKILNKYGVLYRMVFNAMNMEQYTYQEVQEALDHLSWYINDMGVSGIIEFHAADKTQNSDHIHFWISTEEKLVYHKIAQEMVAMGYSNEEDIYIQKYEDNEKIEEIDYVSDEDRSINERFLIKPMGMEAGETLDSINEMLAIEKEEEEEEVSFQDVEADMEASSQIKTTPGILSSLREKYNMLINNINKLFKRATKVQSTSVKDGDSNKNSAIEDKEFWDKFRDDARENFDEHLDSYRKKSSIIEDCTLPKNSETSSILSRIDELRSKIK